MSDKDLQDTDPLLQRARSRVNRKMGFYIHLLVFVLVNGGLYLVNQLTGHVRWSHFPLMGWGLGLLIHGIVTFISLGGEGWRDRMVEAEHERLKRRQ